MRIVTDRQVIEELARSNDLLAIFPPEVVETMELRVYNHKEIICTMGDILDGLYILVSGKLKIYTVLPNGKSILLRFAKAPNLIGDVEWMARYPVKNIVEAVGESSLLLIGREVMLEASNNTAFLRFIIQNLSHKLYTLGNASAINLLYPVENRLASYLISILPPEGETDRQLEEIRTSSLTETADMLGTSYRHLNRVIKEFIRARVLEKKKGRLVVLDEQRLRELASNQLYT